MNTEMGEYLVGSWFEFIKDCDIVSYNVRFPGEGMEALNEFDVIGLNFKTSTAYLCEVATHILGFVYGSRSEDSVSKIKRKFENQKNYASIYLESFKHIHFQFWSPRVAKKSTVLLKEIEGLELVINEEYTVKVEQLKAEAKLITKMVNNPAFRLFQILEHLK